MAFSLSIRPILIRNIFPYTYTVKQIPPIRTIEPNSIRTSTINPIIDNNKDVKVNTLLQERDWWRQGGKNPLILSNPLSHR